MDMSETSPKESRQISLRVRPKGDIAQAFARAIRLAHLGRGLRRNADVNVHDRVDREELFRTPGEIMSRR